MSSRQRYYAPTITDATFDKLIDKLQTYYEKDYGVLKHSQLITLAIIDLVKAKKL